MTEISPTIIWACIGIILIILEVFTTTFFLLFFGISALVVSLLRITGLDNLSVEILLFALVGIAGTFIFRKKIIKSFSSHSEVHIDEHKSITVSEHIAAKSNGSILYRGVPWKAFNDSEYDLKAGDIAIIKKIDGIKLILNQK